LAETERKLDTRRKIIAGGLLFDAASKDKQWAHHLAVLLTRIDRPNDKEPFEGWSIEQYKAESGKLGARKQSQLAAAADDAGHPEEEDDLTPEKNAISDAAE
jgi:hypothetical protein